MKALDLMRRMTAMIWASVLFRESGRISSGQRASATFLATKSQARLGGRGESSEDAREQEASQLSGRRWQ